MDFLDWLTDHVLLVCVFSRVQFNIKHSSESFDIFNCTLGRSTYHRSIWCVSLGFKKQCLHLSLEASTSLPLEWRSILKDDKQSFWKRATKITDLVSWSFFFSQTCWFQVSKRVIFFLFSSYCGNSGVVRWSGWLATPASSWWTIRRALPWTTSCWTIRSPASAWPPTSSCWTICRVSLWTTSNPAALLSCDNHN